MCMITLDAHNRDIVTKMIRAGVQSKITMAVFAETTFREPQRLSIGISTYANRSALNARS